MPDDTRDRDGAAKDPAQWFLSRRERLLQGTGPSQGLEPEGRVRAVVIELGYPEGTTSIACLADGKAELLFSNGGAVLGGGQHESVQLRASAIVREADRFVALAEPAEHHPMPGPGRVLTWFVTDEETLVVETSHGAAEPGQHELSPLLHAGQTVLTELIRIASAQEQGEAY
jgi:hypothetical protein